MRAEAKVQALSALGSGAIVFALAVALILGLRIGEVMDRAESLVSIALNTGRPPPTPEPERVQAASRSAAPDGDSAPRNLHNEATQVVAPPVPFVLTPPPEIRTAPQANVGTAVSSGASDMWGPGQGAGGVGNRFGGGGTGGAGGGGGGPVIGPRQTRGRLTYSDIPDGVLPEGHGEVGVDVLYAVNPNGQVSDCRTERSSGFARLDGLVCQLIEQRFIFRPAKDRLGRPVRSFIAETHSWYGRPERE
jgi:protein TonB